MVVVIHFQAACHALQPFAVLLGNKFGVVGVARMLGEVVIQLIALHGLPIGAGERELVARVNVFVGLVVVHPIGIQRFIVALNNHIALRAVAHIGLPCGFICFNAGYILRQLGQPRCAGGGNAFGLRIGRTAHPAQLFRLPCVRHRPRAA